MRKLNLRKKNIIILSVIFFYFTAHSKISTQPPQNSQVKKDFSKRKTYYFKRISKKTKKVYFKINNKGYLISENCFKNNKCEVLKKVQNFKKRKLEIKGHKNGTAKNPHSQLCSNMGGHNIILEDYSLNEFDFCKFKDNSMISSLDLSKLNHN